MVLLIVSTIFVIDSPTTPNSHRDLGMSNGLQVENDTEYLQMARKGGGHSGNCCDFKEMSCHLWCEVKTCFNKGLKAATY